VFLDKTAELALKTSTLLSSVLTLRDPKFTLLLQDLRFSREPNKEKQFVSLGAWRLITKLGTQVSGQLDTFITSTKKTHTTQQTTNTTPLSTPKISSKNPVEFRKFFMEAMTLSFSDELDKLRETEQFDGKSVHLLVDAMERGVDFFSDEIGKNLLVEWLQGITNKNAERVEEKNDKEGEEEKVMEVEEEAENVVDGGKQILDEERKNEKKKGM